MDTLRQDIRFTLRSVRRDAAFFAAAVAIVALGIAANTSIFSVVHGILFRPLAFNNADRLVWIANTGGDGGLSSVTSRVANFNDWRRLNKSMEDMAAYFAFFDYGTYTFSGSGEPERLVGVGVSQNFLSFLGVRMELGRNFIPEEATDNGTPAVILTNSLWRNRFQSDPAIVGRAITLNEKSTTVVGVLPASFDFRSTFTPGSRAEMLVPFPLTNRTDRWGNTLAIIGRLKPGVTVAQAQSEFDILSENILKSTPDRFRFGASLTPLQDHLTGRFRRGLVLLLAAVGVVLLIACTNLSNLLLARASARRKEIAVRSALGASRGRLIRQLLTESLLVSLAGSAIGLALAFGVIKALASIRDVSIPLLATVQLDSTVLLFTVCAALLTGLLMGIVPALQVSATQEAESLKDSGRGTTAGGSWARSTLVVAQVALACVLLVGAGLLIRSFQRVLDIDLGFRAAHAASWRVEAGQRYKAQADRTAFFERIVRRVEAVPGVESAGFTDALPLSRDRSWGIGVKGVQYPPGQYPIAHPRIVDWRYTKTMGIRLVAGRFFENRDTATSDKVILINEKTARRLWPGEDAVGKQVSFNGDRRVVGVVSNVRHETVESEGGLEAYIPITQSDTNSLELVVRTPLDANAIASGVRAALTEIDPALPASEYQTLDQLVDRAVSPRRFMMLLLGGFALAAVALASVGIYSVISYGVGQRTQEIGIRLALGASRNSVRQMVLSRTLVLAATGIAIGTALAAILGRLTTSLLFGLDPGDPATFAATISSLVVVSLIAGYLPAHRAAHVDPAIALRGK